MLSQEWQKKAEKITETKIYYSRIEVAISDSSISILRRQLLPTQQFNFTARIIYIFVLLHVYLYYRVTSDEFIERRPVDTIIGYLLRWQIYLYLSRRYAKVEEGNQCSSRRKRLNALYVFKSIN